MLDRYYITPEDSFLLTIDIQEKLAPAMADPDLMTARAVRMLQAATMFGIPGAVTEQYPKGLGGSLAPVREAADAAGHPVFAKTRFNALLPEVRELLEKSGRKSVIVTGIETHVCVFQTVRELLKEGYKVYVPLDAVSSRTMENRDNALDLFSEMGACVTNTETLLFDMLGEAGTPIFKQVSKLIK